MMTGRLHRTSCLPFDGRWAAAVRMQRICYGPGQDRTVADSTDTPPP